jgi:hypothetical protein
MTLTCLCGQIRLDVEKRPDFLHECNCSLCRKSGAIWAYYHPHAVRVAGASHGYARQDKADAAAEVHFCPTCGSTTHFGLTPSAVAKFGNVQMGVNMRLAEEGELAGIELRYPDGAAWAGQGEFTYLRPARILGA